MDKGTIDRRIRRALPHSTYDSLKGAYYVARTVVRRNPGRGRMLPDFLICGAVKGGTTSMHGWVTQHPLIAPSKKEIHFFNMNYYRRADWYRTYFPYEREREEFAQIYGRPFLVGEATASYLAHYWTPQRVAKLLPEVKLIVCLRNPVDRAHSQYHYYRRRGTEPLESFEEALTAEEERLRGERERQIRDPHFHSWRVYRWGYVHSSRYAEHLERWLEVIPRERFLFLSFEKTLVPNPQAALDAIYEHLGLPPHDHGELPILNSGEYEPMAPETRARLSDYFRPQNERVYELTGVDFGWDS